jgi:pyruvoyl-dependent arginine decarboxylase (PvlArgDC)
MRGPHASSCPGWLMTAVAPWGENQEDAYDQGLVELGLGDARLIRVEGAMLPMGFEPVVPEPLPMGSLVECHLAIGHAFDGSIASAGVAWAHCKTPEGDECSITASISTQTDSISTDELLRKNFRNKLASRDLEVIEFDIAVDEVTAGQGHYGVALAALILPETMSFQHSEQLGRVRKGLTRSASEMRNPNKKDSMSPVPRGPRRDDDINFNL